MKNPWLTGQGRLMYLGVKDRIACIKTASAKKLEDMIKWPATQSTVRLAAERRLRKIIAMKIKG